MGNIDNVYSVNNLELARGALAGTPSDFLRCLHELMQLNGNGGFSNPPPKKQLEKGFDYVVTANYSNSVKVDVGQRVSVHFCIPLSYQFDNFEAAGIYFTNPGVLSKTKLVFQHYHRMFITDLPETLVAKACERDGIYWFSNTVIAPIATSFVLEIENLQDVTIQTKIGIMGWLNLRDETKKQNSLAF